MKQFIIFVFIAGSLASANSVLAQVPGASQQVDSIQQRRANEQAARSLQEGESVPAIYEGEESDVGPQSVLRINPRRSYIEAMADAQYFYTDNMFLGEDFKQSADVLVSRVQVALAPTAYDLGGGKFAPRLGYRHQWFNFGLIDSDKLSVIDLSKVGVSNPFKSVGLDAFDFNAQTVFADTSWSRDNWIAQGGFDFTRLLSTPGYKQFYEEYVPRWELQRLFPINDGMSFSVGYAGDFRFTSVDTSPLVPSDDYNNRTDHSLFATWTQSFCKSAFVQPYYRFTYTHFTEDSRRDDYLHSLGCGIYYYFTPQISARVFAAYDVRRSNAAQDYEKFDAGAGLNVTFRF